MVLPLSHLKNLTPTSRSCISSIATAIVLPIFLKKTFPSVPPSKHAPVSFLATWAALQSQSTISVIQVIFNAAVAAVLCGFGYRIAYGLKPVSDGGIPLSTALTQATYRSLSQEHKLQKWKELYQFLFRSAPQGANSPGTDFDENKKSKIPALPRCNNEELYYVKNGAQLIITTHWVVAGKPTRATSKITFQETGHHTFEFYYPCFSIKDTNLFSCHEPFHVGDNDGIQNVYRREGSSSALICSLDACFQRAALAVEFLVLNLSKSA